MITASMAASRRPLHALNRLALGPRPGDLDAVRTAGVESWISQQLHPGTIATPTELRRRLEPLGILQLTPIELFEQYSPQTLKKQPSAADRQELMAARRRAQIIIQEAMAARLYRAVYSAAQLQEVMTAFWFNHFNVFAQKGACLFWTGAYEETAIRPHVLGRFRDLLGATAKHPAMLFYLDNWQNTAPNAPGARGKRDGINENYARELMELHTLGVNGGYTQADVIALAHILTGWGIVRRAMPEWRRPRAGAVRTRDGFFFAPARHDYAPQTLLGERISSGGIEMGERALDLLARHPATGRHLSYQLAQYFVADEPPAPLVERLAGVYRETDGNIGEVLATMFASAEFWEAGAFGSKFKTPYQFVISGMRASGVEILNVRPLLNTMAGLGMPLYGSQTPDGYKNTQAAWLSPSAMMARVGFATALGGGHLPLSRPPEDFDGPPESGASIIPSTQAAPPDPVALAFTMGGNFSPRTTAALQAAPARLRAALMLGSPEFMMH